LAGFRVIFTGPADRIWSLALAEDNGSMIATKSAFSRSSANSGTMGVGLACSAADAHNTKIWMMERGFTERSPANAECSQAGPMALAPQRDGLPALAGTTGWAIS
jgi:hypothetical protein